MRNFPEIFSIFLLLAAWTWVNEHNPFFWDTIQLASKHAHFFYQNGLHWAPLPPETDSGHPPVFGFFLASCWTFFGKSLPVSHWVMFPFLSAIALLLVYLGRRFGSGWGIGLVLMVFLDPVLAGQSVMVSPDLVLLCWFLLALTGIITGRNILLGIGVFGLCSISMRGMMTAAALFFWLILLLRFPVANFRINRFSWYSFLPGFAFASWFLIWHCRVTGWLGFHPGSPWAPAFQPVDLSGFIRNLAVLGWRWIDFGRVFEWAVLGFLIWTGVDRREWLRRHRALLLLLLCLFLFLSASALRYHNLSAHRYFLPLFFVFHLLVFATLAESHFASVQKKLLFSILVTGLLTGNCWIYPRGISMDWDATLAHLPYYKLRTEMLQFLDQQKIDYRQVGTAFPNLNTGENLQLNGDGRLFSEKEFTRNNYIFASNIFNDFSEADYVKLERDWILLKRMEQNGVWLNLYGRKQEQPD